MKIKGRQELIETLKPYRFEHAWNVPNGERETRSYYNNFYVGNGHMDMYVDMVGSQALPYQIVNGHNFVYVDGTDQAAGEPHSAALDMEPLFYYTNTHPVINTNDNWAKQAQNEFNNTHGRGQLAFRVSYLPIIDGGFDIARAKNHRQTIELYENICRTEFLYDDSFEISVDSFVSWDVNRLAVFRMTIRNVGAEEKEVSAQMEPFIVWCGKQRPFSLVGNGDVLAWQSDDRELLFPSVAMATMSTTDEMNCTDAHITAAKTLRPGEELTATVYATLLNADTCDEYLRVAQEILQNAKQTGYEKLSEAHINKVMEFWSDWGVKFPHKELDCTYHRNALIIAGNLRGAKYYPSVSTIAGSSYAGVGWGMDNVVLYDFIMQINKAPYTEKVFRYLKEQIPQRGFTEGAQFDYAFDHRPVSEMLVANTSPNYALLMYAYYCYTGDEAFLQDVAFPVMRAVCNFMAGFAREKEGMYGVWNLTVFQGHIWRVHSYDEFIFRVSKAGYADGDNVIDVVGPMRTVLKETMALAERFGIPQEERDDWENCYNRLPIPQNEQHYLTFEGLEYKDEFPKRDVMSAASASLIYPMEMPGLQHQKLENTFRMLFEIEQYGGTFYHTHNYNLILWPTIARTRMASFMHWLIMESPLSYEKAVYNLANDGMMLNEAQGSGAGYFMMTYGNINAAVNHMLLSSFDGAIRVFPTMGEEWEDEASFDGLAAFGGFTVSASGRKGIADEIRIHSQNGGTCRVECPRSWAGAVIDCDGRDVPFSTVKETVRINELDEKVTILVFESLPNKEYQIRSV